MSDRFPAEIEIGGEIPTKLLPKLVQAIDAVAVKNEYYDNVNGDEILAMIERAVQAKKTVKFCDDEASGGSFGDLEDFLYQHRIAFRRHSDAHYEFSAELVLNRPDKGIKGDSTPSDQNGRVLTTLAWLKKNQRRPLNELIAELEVFEESLPPLQLV